MDKRVFDEIFKNGFITTVGVKAEDYNSVEDLIANGIITMPGAMEKINEILAEFDVELVVDDEAPASPTIVEDLNNPAPVIDETPASPTPLVDTPDDKAPLVDTPTEVETVVCDDPSEVEVTIVEETETPKKAKKSKKQDVTEASEDIVVDDNE